MSCQGLVEGCSSREEIYIGFPHKKTAGGVADDELGSSKRNSWLVVLVPGSHGSFQDKPFRGHIVRQKF